MLILMEPPEQPLDRDRPKRWWWRADYLALAAVLFAIAVSLLGVALVVLEASADPPRRIVQGTLA
jgi:hypothetical protein